LSRTCTDPHSIDVSEQAITRCFRQLESNPILDQALMLANMASARLAELCCETCHPDPRQWLRNLNRLARRRIVHFDYFPDRRPDPIGDPGRMPFGTVEEMFAYLPLYGKALGWCGTIAAFYAAALRLMGIPPQAVFRLRALTHELVAVAYHGQDYLISNNWITAWTPASVHFLRDIVRVHNDTVVLDPLQRGYWATAPWQVRSWA